MDASFCPQSQTLSVISNNLVTPPLSSLSPRSGVRPLSREFLGCGRNLRPPGLRYRRKCKNIGFRVQSPRFIFKASLDSQSALFVVTVISISALTVVSLSYSKRKKKNVAEIIGNQSLGNHDLEVEEGLISSAKSSAKGKDAIKETREVGHVYKDEAVLMHLKATVLVPEGAVIGNVVESPGPGITASTGSDFMSRQTEITGVLLPRAFATEMSELQFDGILEDTVIPSKLPMLVVETHPNVLSVPEDNASGEVDEHKNAIGELGKMGDIVSRSFMLRESGREGLCTFFEADRLEAKSTSTSNAVEKLCSDTTFQHHNGFSALLRKSTSKGGKKSAQGFIYNAGSTGRKVPVACYKEGPHFGTMKLRKSKDFSKEKERMILPRDGPRYPELRSRPNGVHVNERRYISQQICSYNGLLKNGRLFECIELLEDLERKGLLNMEKVHHAEFLRSCKKEKAVKEAFHFTKLIPSPTLSTFNMLMSVCASSQDSAGAFEVLHLVQAAGLKVDCKLYTTLISTCARSGKVDEMFKVFHEMVNAGVEPNVHTYGALIDGCAKAGQVAKAFGAYGILRSKNVKPDRVVFNALITACGQSGAVDRAFDVLAEMRAETHPIDPDHVTVGALIKACVSAGQIDRVQEVYNMIHEYNIKGTPEVYTIAVNSCSHAGDWEFACNVYDDMKRNGILPDEMFLSALVDVAGHVHKLDAAFEILQEARKQGIHVGIILYSSLMGACSNAKNWQKALELYEDITSMKLKPTVSTMNALITALCDGDQFQKAMEVLSEMKRDGLRPNTITYSVLLVASEKKDDLEASLMLFSQAKNDGVTPSLVMSRCLIAMCLRRFEKACILGEPVLSFNSGWPQVDSRWTSLALMIYRETITAGILPDMEVFSQVLGCLQLPSGASLRDRLIENLRVSSGSSRRSNLCSLIDGFGEYDPRAFSLFEEAASFGIVPCVSFKESPIIIDARKLQIHTTEVYILTVLKGLKHWLAAGARLPNITILLPVEKTRVLSPTGEKTINLAGRMSQAVAALLRRLGLTYIGNESYGKVRINGVVVKRWFQPKLSSPLNRKPMGLGLSQSLLGKGISDQQRSIRMGNLSLD